MTETRDGGRARGTAAARFGADLRRIITASRGGGQARLVVAGMTAATALAVGVRAVLGP
jgi:hypothetical protein